MEQFLNKLKKIPLPIGIIIILLIIFIIVSLVGNTTVQQKQNTIDFKFDNTKENDINAIIKQLERKIYFLQKEIQKAQQGSKTKEKLQVSLLYKEILIQKLMLKYGPVIDKYLLANGDIVVKFGEDKKHPISRIILPDGTIEQIKNFSVENNKAIVVNQKGDIIYYPLAKNEVVLKELLKKEKTTLLDKKILLDNSIFAIFSNSNKYKINFDGTILKVKKFIITKDGNIIFEYSTGGNTNIVIKEQVEKLSNIEKQLNQLSNIHGKVTDKHVLSDGSVVVTTADGKKFIVHPDGTVEEIKNYKIKPDGTIEVTDINGNKKNLELSSVEKKLNKLSLIPGKKIVDKHVLADGSMVVTTADGKKYIIYPNGTVEEISDYKVNPNGTISIKNKKGKVYFSTLSRADNSANNLGKKHGGIKEKHVLADGSIVMTTADGKKFIVHPDGTVEEIQDYKVNPDGTLTYTNKNGKTITKNLDSTELYKGKLEREHGKIVDKHVLSDGSMLVTTADGKKFIIHPDGTVEEIKDYKIGPNGNVIVEKYHKKAKNKQTNIENKNNIIAKKKKLKDINDNINTFIDENGNKYYRDKNGNWYRINPDGTKEFLGKNVKIDSKGNIYLDGKKIGKVESYTLKNDKMIDKNGNIIESVQIGKEKVTEDKRLNDIAKKHGKVIDKHVLADGSIVMTTADGKKFIVHPDGTVEEIQDYKVNPDGTVEILDKNGNIKEKKLSKSETALKHIQNKLKNIKEKHILSDGSILLTTKDGKKILIHPDGTIEEIKNYKIGPNGKVKIIKKDGKVKFNSLSSADLTANNIAKKHGKIVDKHVLADGSIVMTTADGKKFIVHPDGTVEEIKDYKVNPDGTISYTTKNGQTLTKNLSTSEKVLNSLKKSLGPIKSKKILSDGSILLTTKDGKKIIIHPDGKVEEIKDYKIKPDGTIEITKLNGKKVILGKKYLNKIFVDENGNKYLLDENGNKHYLPGLSKDKNGRIYWIDRYGKKHYIEPTNKTAIIRYNKDGSIEVLGEGAIVNLGNKKELVLMKKRKIILGYPVLNVYTKDNFYYYYNDGKIYLNYKLLGSGYIFKKDNYITVVFNNNKNRINLEKVKYFTPLSQYFVDTKQLFLFRVYKNTLYKFNLINNKVEAFYKFKIENKKLSLNKSTFELKETKVIPVFSSLDTGLNLAVINNYYEVFNLDKKVFFKYNKSTLNFSYLNKNITLTNKFTKFYINNIKNSVKIFADKELDKFKINNKYYMNFSITGMNLILNNVLKGLLGYGDLFYYYNEAKNTLYTFNKYGYSTTPLISIDITDANVLEGLLSFNNIKLNKIISINIGYKTDLGNYFVDNNNNIYLNKVDSIKRLGKGKLKIKNGKLIMVKENGEIISLGNLKKEHIFNIKNGQVEKTLITNKDIQDINEINSVNNLINTQYIVLSKGENVLLTDNSLVFYNDKNEVVILKNYVNLENKGKGTVIIDKNTRKVYFQNAMNGKYEELGTYKSINVKNNIILETTKGIYAIKNNNIFKLENNNVYDLKLKPLINNNYLYGINENNEYIYLGKILNIYTGNIKINKITTSKKLKELKITEIPKSSFKIVNGKLIQLVNGNEKVIGKVDKKVNKFVVVENPKNKEQEVTIVDTKTNKIYKIKKNKNGQYIITDENGNKVNNKHIKIKDKKLYIDDKFVKNLTFNENSLINKKSKKKKYLSEQTLLNLFQENFFKRKKLVENKNKKKNINQNINKLNMNNQNNIKQNNLILGQKNQLKQNIFKPEILKYKLVVLKSERAQEKNINLFGKDNNKQNMNKPIYINAENGMRINDVNNLSNNYYLMPGRILDVRLLGGALVPVLSLAPKVATAQRMITLYNQFKLKSFFIFEHDVTMKNGTIIPLQNGILVTEPQASTAERMFFKPEKAYFYDPTTAQWYSGSMKGQIISQEDSIPGLPGIIIDTRDKYMAKATVYSILQGVSEYLNASKNPLANSLAGGTNANIGSIGVPGSETGGGVGQELGQSLLAGASQQMKNLNQFFMALIESQVPFLAVKSGVKAYFIVQEPIYFSPVGKK